MKNLIWGLILISLLLISSCSDDTTKPSNSGTIEGKVLDAKTMQPIANALITTVPTTNSIISNSDGTFNFNELEEGDYIIRAKKIGYYDNSATVKVINDKIAQATILLYDFETANNPPEKPKLLSPENESQVGNKKVEFKWLCSDDDDDKLTYDVYLSKSNPPSQIVAQGITETSLIVTNLDSNETYYWMIVARDDYTYTESEVFKIKVIGTDYVPTNNLILYYTFDENNADDDSGNSNNGTLVNNPQLVAGKIGNALRLVGTGDLLGKGSHIMLPNINFKQLSSFTIALWIKEESLQYFAGEAYINWGNASTGWVGISNFIKPPENTTLVVNFSVGCEASDNYKRQEPLWIEYDPINRNKWVHYALVHNNGITTGYIDGRKIGSKNHSIVNVETVGAIGKHWWNYGGTKEATSMTFSVDDVRVYKVALTENQILNLTN